MYRRSLESYFRNKDGFYVAWSLHSPAVPKYGQWCFIDLVQKNSFEHCHFICNVDAQEKYFIESNFLVWGMKMAREPWAIMMGRPSSFSLPASVRHHFASASDSSIGV